MVVLFAIMIVPLGVVSIALVIMQPVIVSALLSFWLMASPAVFGTTGIAAPRDNLVGPLVAVVAVTAISEVVRSVRYLNVLTGLWLVAVPWFLSGATTGSTVNDVAVGVALILLAIPCGAIRNHYGDWSAWMR